MRYILVTRSGVVDSSSGEVLSLDRLEEVLLERPGGVIAGNNMYPVLATLVPMIKCDSGWSAKLKLQHKKKVLTGRVGGGIYFTHLSYRFPKERRNGKRHRPKSIKWLVLNLELFTETDDIAGASKALVDLADRRGISPRYSPGSFGGALLKASPLWSRDRNPAPWFISEKARFYLPGNYYALRVGIKHKTIDSALYVDQKSSHHTISSSVVLPDPRYLRARGRLRAVENGEYPRWLDSPKILKEHTGLLCAIIHSKGIPEDLEHLYPPWARLEGTRAVWIWTPELRILNSRVKLLWVSCALTSFEMDKALREFAEWSLAQLKDHNHPAIKPALLAAYGLLGVQVKDSIKNYTVTGRPKPESAKIVKLPLIDEVYCSTIESVRVPVIQNVVARGVIEAETRTRSLEYARLLEGKGVMVSQIYADGLIAVTDSIPEIPDGWRIAGVLSNLVSSSPNTIVSDEIVRMPGVPSGRRTIHIEQTSRALDKVV